jgi:predicted nucleic acid-binding protein
MTTFVDTSVLYAILDEDDCQHSAAKELWSMVLLDQTRYLLTTNYVLIEASALVQHRLGMAAVRTLLDVIVPVMDIHWIGVEEHRAATAAFLLANRRQLSLVDCSSFEVMRQLGLTTALSFDSHFHEHGFRLLEDGDGAQL